MNPNERKVRDILFLTRESFRVAEIEDPEREAAFLISHYINCKPVELSLKGDEFISEEQYRDLSYAIRRRFRHEPSQYIIGEQEFYGYTFKVRPGVLIPRPETELLVDEVKKSLNAKKKDAPPVPFILDLCTGSGALALALANELPSSRLIATDISRAALGIANENALSLGLSKRVGFLLGDLYAALKEYSPDAGLKDEISLTSDSLEGSFDYIVSNPPYVSTSEYKVLASEIKDYEPKEALVAGPDGLKFIKKVVLGAAEWLKPGGTLMIEIGFDHSRAVKTLIKETGSFTAIELAPDLSGIARVVTARRKKRV
ncbi:MAG: peptide chain release factor N(5)-glutamine methyltransferase [Proteobacteria bacterium]|nr:peptide chain release factor N(5)-glutamine methyltransferase [Pseudomonadota bacterium]